MPHYHTSEEDIPSEEDDIDLDMDLETSDTDTDYYQKDRSYRRRRIVRFPPLDCEGEDCPRFLRAVQNWDDRCTLIGAEQGLSDQQAALARIKAVSESGNFTLMTAGLTDIAMHAAVCHDINVANDEHYPGEAYAVADDGFDPGPWPPLMRPAAVALNRKRGFYPLCQTIVHCLKTGLFTPDERQEATQYAMSRARRKISQLRIPQNAGSEHVDPNLFISRVRGIHAQYEKTYNAELDPDASFTAARAAEYVDYMHPMTKTLVKAAPHRADTKTTFPLFVTAVQAAWNAFKKTPAYYTTRQDARARRARRRETEAAATIRERCSTQLVF